MSEAYYIGFVDDGRARIRLFRTERTARQWRGYLCRRLGYTSSCHLKPETYMGVSMVHADLGRDYAVRETFRARASAENMAAFLADRPFRRAERIANKWKPYLRGRWPAWTGLLFGFPLPGERRAR